MSGFDRDADETLTRAELGEAAISGVRLGAVSRVVGEVLAFAISVVLARLVPPSEFGRAAVVVVLQVIAVILTFEGFGSVLVQRRSTNDRLLATAFTLSVMLGAALSAATYLLAPATAGRLFDERTADLVQLMSPAFLIAAFAVVPRSVLQRRLDFRALTIAEVGSVAAGALGSLGLAMAGLDAEAIVGGSLLTVGVLTAIMLAYVPPIRPRLHRSEAREIAAFGIPAAIAGLTFTARRNVDYIIVGARLNATVTGFYWRAFQLGVEYQAKVTGIMQRIAFPTLARAPSVEDLRDMRGKIVRTTSALVFPFLVIFVVIAPDLIPWLYGPRWEPAVLPARILVVAGMANALLAGVEAVALAAGKPRALMNFSILFLVVYGGSIMVAAPHGLTVVAVVASAIHVVMLVVAYATIFNRLAGVPVSSLWTDTRAALVSCVPAVAASASASWALHRAAVPDPVLLGVVAAIGLAIYALALRLLFRAEWSALAGLVARVSRRRRPVPAMAARTDAPAPAAHIADPVES